MLRIILNLFVMAAELAAIAGIAYGAYLYPAWFAGATLVLAFLVGLPLEAARMSHELPFYFERKGGPPRLFPLIAAFFETTLKALLAGAIAMLTFSGTDPERLAWVAVLFGATLFAGTSLLRRLNISLDAIVARWGFFRLAAPLGILFSAGLAILEGAQILPQVQLRTLIWQVYVETAWPPKVEQVGELMFIVDQTLDQVMASLLSVVMPRDWAEALAVMLSANLLTGFVIAVYAVVIGWCVAVLEGRQPLRRLKTETAEATEQPVPISPDDA